MAGRFYLIRIFLLTMILVSSFPVVQGMAASTVDCHCFRERSFAPENPSAFDPYILATVQNRLMAHAFDVPRKEIVSLKMSGASADNLWVVYWVSHVSGLAIEKVQNLFVTNQSWRTVIVENAVDPEALGSYFVAALTADDQEALAWAVVAQNLEKYFSASVQQLAVLREDGASLQESVLAALLGMMRTEDPLELFRKARINGWGSLTVATGTTIESIESFIASGFGKPA